MSGGGGGGGEGRMSCRRRGEVRHYLLTYLPNPAHLQRLFILLVIIFNHDQVCIHRLKVSDNIISLFVAYSRQRKTCKRDGIVSGTSQIPILSRQ